MATSLMEVAARVGSAGMKDGSVSAMAKHE
jgi:hypothetical protein